MSFRDYLASTFPNARVTSGARDPGSPLGRVNPRSWHNVGKAWDTAPVDGMSFDDYVDRIRKDGWNVLEARDEVRNPSRHATGPHWHVAVDGRKPMAGNGLADIMKSIYPMAAREGVMNQAPLLTPQQEQAAQQGLASFLPQMQVPQGNTDALKPKAFGKGGRGWEILGIIGDALQTAGGGQATYAPFVLNQREQEEEGRRRLAEHQAQRDGRLGDLLFIENWKRNNPAPTNAQREYEWAKSQPGMEGISYRDWVTNYYRPQFFEQGGQRYQVTQGGGMPQGYDPGEWEVVE